LDEEREPRFTGWIEKENQGLQVKCGKRTKVYRLDEKENQNLQVE